ncbi:hypothetical protein P3T76_013496 [Phytophthora citrophthora]|uniref:Uncharacterized protein n=1 Tax=Phytophthora citrophthora TaxID=4793 RepID=A0AAD9LCX3_9STRA|nr:hypothetical protein P3T76_013496 [Phytophthora citrophthora]
MIVTSGVATCTCNPVNHVDAASKNPRASSLGKRKASQGKPFKDPPRQNVGAFKYFYCAGAFNDVDNIGPHMKFDCPKLKMNRGGKVTVFQRPRGDKRKRKGQGKGKEQESYAKDAPASPIVSIRPASSMEMVTTPGSDPLLDIDPTTSDEAMASIDVGANAGQVQETGDQVHYAEIAERMNKMQMRARQRCGFGLTSGTTKFQEMRPNRGYMFTFAQGSKHSNTHIGTVKMYLHEPDGIRPYLFENIALVPHAKSNILSELTLKQCGYQNWVPVLDSTNLNCLRANWYLWPKPLTELIMCKTKQ